MSTGWRACRACTGARCAIEASAPLWILSSPSASSTMTPAKFLQPGRNSSKLSSRHHLAGDGCVGNSAILAQRCVFFRSGEKLKDAVRDAMLKALPHASPDPAIAFLQWLGVFDPNLSTAQSGSVVKTFCALLEAKLKCVLRAACTTLALS
jgi:hypothetical protein